MARVDRRTVDLSGYPDLVVIYLGMRVRAWTGLKTLFRTGRAIQAAAAERPDGLLLHEMLIYSLFPPHLGMRQYWRDLDSLETWTRSIPHSEWWRNFLRDPEGIGFWHEAYFMRGGMEAIYGDVPVPIGFTGFAPLRPAQGSLFSARTRAGFQGQVPESVVPEDQLYPVTP